jgi:hypothetical protein
MRNGESRVFTLNYKNDGDTSLATGAYLEVKVGSDLNVDLTSFKDTYPGDTTACSIPNATSLKTAKNYGTGGSIFHYLPGSCKTSLAQSGSLDLPAGIPGTFTFSATLNTSAAAGTTLDSDSGQGIIASLTLNTQGSITELSITVASPSSSSSSSSSTSSTSSSSTSTSSSSSNSPSKSSKSASISSSSSSLPVVVTPRTGGLSTTIIIGAVLSILIFVIYYYSIKKKKIKF